MLGLWKSRVTLMGRLCRSGMISGTVSGVQLVVVLARDDVSGPVESVLYFPMPLEPVTCSGWASVMGRELRGRQSRWVRVSELV